MARYVFGEDANVNFITSTTADWLPVFIEQEPLTILAESLDYCHQNKHLRIAAYVFMPTHMHAILFDEEFDVDRLKRTLDEWRSFTGHELAKYVDQHLGAPFRFSMHHHRRGDRLREFWQPSEHPTAASSADWLLQKATYIHNNPVRKGLVSDPSGWRYSSARFYETGERGPVPVTPVPF